MAPYAPRSQGGTSQSNGSVSARMALFTFFCCLFAGWLWYYSSSEDSVPPDQRMSLEGHTAEELQLVNSYLQNQGLTDLYQLAAIPIPAGKDLDEDLQQALRKVVPNIQLWKWLDDMQLTVVYSSLIGLNVMSLEDVVKILHDDSLQIKVQSWHDSQVLHQLLAAASELEQKWSTSAEEETVGEQGSSINDTSDAGSSWFGFWLKIFLALVAIVIVCLVSVGVIYVTVIAPIIAIVAVIVAVLLQILLLPLTLLTGQRPQINVQQVFNDLVPSPLRFFQRFIGTIRVGSPAPPRIYLGASSQHRRGRAQEPRGFYLGLKDRITRNYLDYNKCEVLWSHDNYQKVGCLSVVTVKLHCANGSPYSLQASDEFVCSIRKNAARTTLPFVLEPASPVGATELKVSFTVRAVGMYIVQLSVSGMPIGSGQYERSYLPGPVDVSRTIVLSNSQTMVARRGVYNAVSVDAKDSFGNPTEMDMSLLDMMVVKNDRAKTAMETELVRSQKDDGSYELLFKLEDEGAYYGTVKYNCNMVGTDSFTIICLEGSVVEEVDKCVSKRSLNNWYEARVVPARPNEKGRRVYCYVSPRQLQVREYFLKFIPKRRLFTCRVCPSTKIHLLEEENQFTIDDGYQEVIELESEYRGVIAATFSKYLLGNIGGSENFQSKRSFFFGELSKTTIAHSRRMVNIKVERSDLLHNAYKILKRFAVADWKAQFHVSFVGEEGLDWGGVQREFLHLLCCKLFDSSGLFTRFTEDQQALVHPNPNRPQQLKLKYFELAGKVVGKCLFESALGNSFSVTARFTRSFLAQIIGLRVNYRYFETDDPELFTTKVKYIRENDVDGLDLVFAEELYSVGRAEPEIVPLRPGGESMEVTNANKQEYLNLLAQYKLVSRVKEELEYFLKGLNDIVPENLLSIFDENELELLMCGVSEIDMDDWKSNSAVQGNDTHFQTMVSWFWTAASSYSQEERARLLQFTTGSSQLPSDGFSALNPKFTISHAPIAGRLPSAHTCFNELCLPDHATYEAFESALKIAITEGSEGFGVV